MRQHLAARHVTHSEDPLDGGLHGRPHRHHPAIHRHSQRLEPQALRPRRASDAHEHLRGRDRLALALGVDLDGNASLPRRDLDDLNAGPQRHAPAGEEPRDLGRGFLVLDGQHARQGFEDGDLDPVGPVDVGELHAHRAGADHDQRDGLCLGANGAIGGDHLRLVYGDAGQRLGLRARREDHGPACLERVDAVLALDLDDARPLEGAYARDQRDLVLAEEELDALGHAVGDAPRALDGLGVVGPPLPDRDAELLGAVKEVDDFGVAQERLGGDASPVEADAAGPIVFDGGHGEAELGAADGGDVAAGARADHDDVEGLIRHGVRREAGAALPAGA